MPTLKPITAYLVDDHGPDGHQYFPGRSAMGTTYDEVVIGQGDNRHDAFEDAIDALAELDYELNGIPVFAKHSFEGNGQMSREEASDSEFSYYVCIFVRS